MQMTDGEVVMNIMQAKDQRSQITICADLNCCSEEKIKDILKAQGVDLRSLRGATKKRVAETKPHEPKKIKSPAASTNGGGRSKTAAESHCRCSRNAAQPCRRAPQAERSYRGRARCY